MKTNVYKPSGKKGAKRSKNKLGNKWFIFGGIILIAIVGIIAIRVSQAAVGVSVSYTHLDVYKRQKYSNVFSRGVLIAD